MALAAGTRLGPYEILEPLGAGGMGEVYRARDPRLKRDVAIKVLPERFASRPDSVRRFHSEATTTGALNHPNILAVYDTGTHEGHPYLVTELLDGETLRDRIQGAILPVRKVLGYSVQMARGLAAAHEKGVVHRDLKPSNLFVTKDGAVKILDFGLATVRQGIGTVDSEVETLSASPTTDPGTVLGTVGYMAPEQVKGQPADHRSDIFSFGAVLYEMLAGQKAFRGETKVDVMNAILRADPPELAGSNSAVSPALDQLVSRCLDKQPDERFQSARDVSFYLESLTGSGSGRAQAPIEAGRIGAHRIVRRVVAVAVLLGLGATAWLAGRAVSPAPSEPPIFRRLTFRRGLVFRARFGPDAETIVYSADWGPRPSKTKVYTGRIGTPDARLVGDIALVDVSKKGELLIGRSTEETGVVLARQSLAGGTPRDLLEGQWEADWGPDGEEMALIREGNPNKIEYPVGTVLYESPTRLSDLRVSPRGDQVAFFDFGLDGGLVVVDRERRKRVTPIWSVSGLSWSADGEEVWYTGSKDGPWALHAVSPSGEDRTLLRAPSPLRLDDIAPDGRVLLVQQDLRIELRGRLAGDEVERDLSWLGMAHVDDLTSDGTRLLFTEMWSGREGSSVYLWQAGDTAPVRLSGGRGVALSPDGEWALTIQRSPTRLVLVPTGPGEPRTLSHQGLVPRDQGRFLPQGDALLFAAQEAGRPSRTYLIPLDGDPARAVGPEGVLPVAVSPDGLSFIGDDRYLHPLDGSEPRKLVGLTPRSCVGGWHADSQSLFVLSHGSEGEDAFASIELVNRASGDRTPWRDLVFPDTAGLGGCLTLAITPDGSHYAYSCLRVLMTLYLVEGLQ